MSKGTKVIALISLILILSGSLLFLSGRFWKKSLYPAKLEPLRVMESARTPYFLPQYLALSLGFFREQGLEVRISTTSPEAIRAALADGRTDVALCGLQKSVFSPLKTDSRPLAFARITRFDGSYLLAREDIENFQWAGVKDKTVIGGQQDYSAQIILEEVLRRNGLSPTRDVTVYHNIPEALRVGAFRAGTGNFLQLGEPEASLAEKRSYGRIVASVGEAAGEMPVTVYSSNRVYYESHLESIQKFTNGLDKALRWLKEHSPAEAAEAAAPFFPNLDKEVLLSSVERYQTHRIWTDEPSIDRESFSRFLTAVKNSGELVSPVSYEESVVIIPPRYEATEQQEKKRKWWNRS